MLKSVEGTFRDGRVELAEGVDEPGPVPVIVTFLSNGSREVALTARSVRPQQAADLRSRLKAFAEDWGRPEMDAYDAL